MDDPQISWRKSQGTKRNAADRYCTAQYAGDLAEDHFVGLYNEVDQDDCDRVTAYFQWSGVRGGKFVGDETWKGHEDRLREKSTTLVRALSTAIEVMADALIARRSLGGDEIKVLMYSFPRDQFNRAALYKFRRDPIDMLVDTMRARARDYMK
jgi:hypothetical protein